MQIFAKYNVSIFQCLHFTNTTLIEITYSLLIYWHCLNCEANVSVTDVKCIYKVAWNKQNTKSLLQKIYIVFYYKDFYILNFLYSNYIIFKHVLCKVNLYPIWTFLLKYSWTVSTNKIKYWFYSRYEIINIHFIFGQIIATF